MKTEFNLSEKIKEQHGRIKNLPVKFYKKEFITMTEHCDIMESELRTQENNVKEFIRLLKEEIIGKGYTDEEIIKQIDKLAGDKLK